MALTIGVVMMDGLVPRFATMSGAGEADLCMTYSTFVICTLLNDWSCIDLPSALSYIQQGGYGQTPEGESLGGPTYCALAALHLVPPTTKARLQRTEWHPTVRWLLHMQGEALAPVGGGGFAGRTNKLADACYGFGVVLLLPYALLSPLLCGVCVWWDLH
jgi:geranylgeranyl transferase type-1 subunit beta